MFRFFSPSSLLSPVLQSHALALCACLLFTASDVMAATSVPGTRIAVLENCFIRESSGICASRRNPGILWTHNDSGSGPYLFAFNERGNDMGTFRLSAGSQDIEDIAAASINGKNYLLIANTGVDGHGAPSYLYLMEEPEVNESTAKTMQGIPRDKISVISFRWPGGVPRNCEAVGLSPKGEVFLATKSYASLIYMLQLTWNDNGAVSASPLNLIARYQFKTAKGSQTTPTGMDISPDGRSMAFVYDPYNDARGVEFTLPKNGSWSTSEISSWAKIEYGQMCLSVPQPEGICYSADGKNLYVTSEGGKNRATKPRAIGPGNNYPDRGVTPLWKIPRIPIAPTGVAALLGNPSVFASWTSITP